MDSPSTLDGSVATDASPPSVVAPAAERGPAPGLILLVVLAAFWPTVASFPSTWNASYQEHGFFVGGLVLWLVWKHRHRVVGLADRGLPDLLPVVGLLSLAWLFAVIMNVRLVHQLIFWALATTATLTIFGWGARRPILVTAATFLLAIPFWSALQPILQRLTTIMSGAIAQAGGVEAEIGYDTITISTGTFLVESGCSGINYLMGGLVLGAFYAHLVTDRWQTQAKILATAGAMSIVGNWIRVAALVFLGEATAMQSPYIANHLWQGWAIFTLLMIPTYYLARRIEERDARRGLQVASGDVAPEDAASYGPRSMGLSHGAESLHVAGPGFDDRELAAPSRISDLSARAMRTAFVAVAGPVLLYGCGALPRGDDIDRTPDVFALEDGWTLGERSGAGSAWSPDFHGFDELARWTARGPGGTIHAARYYFAGQRQGEELIQYGNRIAPESLTAADRIIGPVGRQRQFVHEAVVRDPETPRVVWYWYRVGGIDTPFEIKAKLLEIVAFFRRTPAAELVVLDATCDPEDCTRAAMTLRAAFGVPTDPGSTQADTSADSGEADSAAPHVQPVPDDPPVP